MYFNPLIVTVYFPQYAVVNLPDHGQNSRDML
jgi:hypothetical protein